MGEQLAGLLSVKATTATKVKKAKKKAIRIRKNVVVRVSFPTGSGLLPGRAGGRAGGRGSGEAGLGEEVGRQGSAGLAGVLVQGAGPLHTALQALRPTSKHYM